VQPFQDSCSLVRASCSFCGRMNGNCVRMKLGQRGRESLWKMVGMNSLVWDAFACL